MSTSKGSDEEFVGKKEDASGQSPEEIENEIKSTPVTWNPFTVLPKEIYLMIFNKLENRDDKENFMNAHSEWYELFKAQLTTFLFHKVCPILAPKEDIKSEEKLLDLRLVCHDWDLAIQNYIQLHPSLFGFSFKEDVWFEEETIHSSWAKVDSDSYPIKSDKYLWGAAPGVDKVANKLSSVLMSCPPDKNPLLTRKFSTNMMLLVGLDLNLELIDLEAMRQWWNQIQTYLETFGQEIWHCRLIFHWHVEPALYWEIVKWLSLMPNLKTLHLYAFGWQRFTKNHEMYTNLVKRLDREREDVQVAFENLQILHANRIPPFLYDKIVKGVKALDSLQIMDYWRDSSLTDYQFGNYLSTLKEARLTLKGIEDFKYLWSLGQFPLLRKLIIINLQRMKVKTKKENQNMPEKIWPKWKIIWSLLEQKFQALEDLDLRLSKAIYYFEKGMALEQSLECRLHLPKLKKLRIILPNLGSLDFLLPLKNLEYLNVVIEHTDCNSVAANDLGGREILKFNQYSNAMWESNIWEEFPKLRQLVIETVTPRGTLTGMKRNVVNKYDYEKVGKMKKFSKKNYELLSVD